MTFRHSSLWLWLLAWVAIIVIYGGIVWFAAVLPAMQIAARLMLGK